jgi:hypothetical protein
MVLLAIDEKDLAKPIGNFPPMEHLNLLYVLIKWLKNWLSAKSHGSSKLKKISTSFL